MTPHIEMPDLDSIANPFDVAPEGRYAILCEDSELTATKETQQPMIKLTHKIQGDDPATAGKMIFENLVLDPASKGYKYAIWRWAEYCKLIGSDGKDADDVKGQRFDVEVGVKPGNEEYPNPSNTIKKVYGRA